MARAPRAGSDIMPTEHLSLEQALAHVLGTTAANERASVEEHSARCDACAKRVERLRAEREEVRRDLLDYAGRARPTRASDWAAVEHRIVGERRSGWRATWRLALGSVGGLAGVLVLTITLAAAAAGIAVSWPAAGSAVRGTLDRVPVLQRLAPTATATSTPLTPAATDEAPVVTTPDDRADLATAVPGVPATPPASPTAEPSPAADSSPSPSAMPSATPTPGSYGGTADVRGQEDSATSAQPPTEVSDRSGRTGGRPTMMPRGSGGSHGPTARPAGVGPSTPARAPTDSGAAAEPTAEPTGHGMPGRGAMDPPPGRATSRPTMDRP